MALPSTPVKARPMHENWPEPIQLSNKSSNNRRSLVPRLRVWHIRALSAGVDTLRRGGTQVATIADVAGDAGVSPSTVSYVLSGKRSISASTRHRVEQSIRKLGYRPHAGARALAGNRSNVLALVVPLRTDQNLPVVMRFVDRGGDLGPYLRPRPPAADQGRGTGRAAQGRGLVDGGRDHRDGCRSGRAHGCRCCCRWSGPSC